MIGEQVILNENIARYSNLTFPLEPELGRCSMSVRDILKLAPGSIIKLSRPEGSRIEILVGGASFGTGELVQFSGRPALKFSGFQRKS
jgi:flagellar motor switch/type III secretory pathway protein FliN